MKNQKQLKIQISGFKNETIIMPEYKSIPYLIKLKKEFDLLPANYLKTEIVLQQFKIHCLSLKDKLGKKGYKERFKLASLINERKKFFEKNNITESKFELKIFIETIN